MCGVTLCPPRNAQVLTSSPWEWDLVWNVIIYNLKMRSPWIEGRPWTSRLVSSERGEGKIKTQGTVP